MNHRCEHEGCTQDAGPCYLPNEDYTGFDRKPAEWYCSEHAHEHGYCSACGEFWGGIESFDFNPNGLCDHCQDEVDADFDGTFEDDEGWTYDVNDHPDMPRCCGADDA